MTEVRPPTPRRPDDATTQPATTQPATPAPRRFTRPGLIMLGFLVVASVPLIALAQHAAKHPAPAAGRGPAERAGSSTGSSAAIAPAPGLDAGVAAPAGPPLDEGGRPFRRTEMRQGEAEPVDPPDFECKPVKKDEAVAEDLYPVPLPPFTRNIFPCSRCHDKPTDFNMTPRNLTLEHLDIKLNHGPREQWCYGCHNPSNRDTLRLASGREISFLKSYELCGQCHGEKLRDWRQGIHGRRTGCWNGKREYLLCVHCHNQHSPHFKPLQPKPRPLRPDEIKLGGGQ